MMEMIFGLIFMIPLVLSANFWVVLLMFLTYAFKFLMNFNMGPFYSNLSYSFGIDLVSFFMILLSFWICSLMFMASENLYKLEFYWEVFTVVVILLMVSLFIAFSTVNLFVFYLFYEVSLIPTLFLIVGWGYQPERIGAGVYLLFYTLFASLPMMIALFYLYNFYGSLDFYFYSNVDNLLLYLSLNMVFFVKIPMFLIHLWLPKAHVEAPVSGSMILAGVLLKLGGYGLMRVLKIFLQIGMKINIVFVTISLIGAVIVSLMCIRQSDMKMLIAYSSVSHMGLVLSGLLTLNMWGYSGAFILMLAHGLCSSGLFVLANLLYERTSSRSIYLNKGMINIMPSLTLWWFLLCSSNMAAPPSLNLLGEIFIINSLMYFSMSSFIILFILIFLSASYSLFLYSYTQHGGFYSGLYSFSQINIREYLLLFLHWIPLNIFIIKSDVFICGF